MTAPALKRHPLLAAACAAMLAIAGCSSGGSAHGGSSASTEAAPEPVAPEVSVADGSDDHNPNDPVTVKAGEGTLEKVTMTNEEGKVVKAKFNDDHTSWTTDEDLGYSRTYTIKAEGSNGKTTTTTFKTVNPTHTTGVSLSPIPDSVVGVGQSISFNFGRWISDRKAAQKAITITTEPHVEGAFFWLNPHLLRWRPEHYWKPGTKVTVKVDLYGKNLGDGVWGEEDNSTSFTIGDEVIAIADDNTKQITITKNGDVVKTMPTSMGMPAFPTPNGVYTIGDQYPSLIMDSSTFGLPVNSPNGYRTNVQWATQMSWSGIFVHSAPWSLWAQGVQDTSHGCLNVSPVNAQWFQQFTKRGDLVIVKNTQGGTLNGYDGLGDWNIPWSVWKKGNADGGLPEITPTPPPLPASAAKATGETASTDEPTSTKSTSATSTSSKTSASSSASSSSTHSSTATTSAASSSTSSTTTKTVTATKTATKTATTTTTATKPKSTSHSTSSTTASD